MISNTQTHFLKNFLFLVVVANERYILILYNYIFYICDFILFLRERNFEFNIHLL